jgi:hypothetical protein
MAEMAHRIKQLEEALATLQSSISPDPHPLLRDELLTIKSAPDKGRTLDDEGFGDDINDTIDALGILTIGDQGAKYYGPSAGTEVGPLLRRIIASLTYIFLGTIHGMTFL